MGWIRLSGGLKHDRLPYFYRARRMLDGRHGQDHEVLQAGDLLDPEIVSVDDLPLLVALRDSLISWRPGDVRDTTRPALDPGWIFASGGTIGGPGSNATERAHMDTRDLFTLYFDGYTDAALPIQTSTGAATTRGAYANADAAWLANCRITVPDLRGRVTAGRDDMGGTPAGRITAAGGGVDGTQLLAAGGAQSATLSVANLPAHSHTATFAGAAASMSLTVTDPGHDHYIGYSDGNIFAPFMPGMAHGNRGSGAYTDAARTHITVSAGSYTPAGNVTIGNTGLGQALPVLPPVAIVNKVIKL